MQQPINTGRQYIIPNPEKIRTYHSPGINYIWYLTIGLIGKSRCRIIRHWRIHRCAKDHPTASQYFHIVEDEKRLPTGWPTRNAIAVNVTLDSKNKRLRVVNPGYVFGYDGKTNQPAMHV